MARKPTARDVAREADVSLATVDRVLNNRGGVTEDKERRVVLAARRLGLDRALDFRAARTLRVAVLIQPPSNPFHAALAAAIEAENRGPNPFNMQLRIFHVDPRRPTRTAVQIGKLAESHDALMICVSQSEEIAEALIGFTNSGKPLVALATDLGPGVPHIYVGPDNRRAGRVAGDLMGRLMSVEGGDVVMVAGLFSMLGHRERRDGFRAVLEERYPRCRICVELESEENAERAGALVAAVLAGNPGVRGIYNASRGVRPIADALARMRPREKVVFITHELTEDRRWLLLNGAIDVIIDQKPALEIRTAIEALAARIGRLDPGPAETITPVGIHMIENC